MPFSHSHQLKNLLSNRDSSILMGWIARDLSMFLLKACAILKRAVQNLTLNVRRSLYFSTAMKLLLLDIA
jgi:hypothetical protein